MSLIHENLYDTGDLSKVDFKDYLHKLTHSIISSNGNSEQNIEIQIDVEDLYFDIQTAIPLGLIINELINNAYKHAFLNRSEGIINVGMKQKADGFEIMIKDNGVGMIVGDGLGQGMNNIKSRVEALNGDFAYHTENKIGSNFDIKMSSAFGVELIIKTAEPGSKSPVPLKEPAT